MIGDAIFAVVGFFVALVGLTFSATKGSRLDVGGWTIEQLFGGGFGTSAPSYVHEYSPTASDVLWRGVCRG